MISQRARLSSNVNVSAGALHLTACTLSNMIKVVLHYA